MVDRILGGAKHPDLTYVIFETGVAPIRREVRLDVPLYDKNVPYVAAAFPRLERRGRSTHAHVAIGGTKREATLICDMDVVVARDFRTGLPAVIFRTLAASAAKAAWQKKPGRKQAISVPSPVFCTKPLARRPISARGPHCQRSSVFAVSRRRATANWRCSLARKKAR